MDLQERELEDAKDELNLAEHENKLLRKSMELLSEEADVNRCVEPYWHGKKKIVYSGMQKKKNQTNWIIAKAKKKNMCVYCHMLKKIRVGRSEIIFF